MSNTLITHGYVVANKSFAVCQIKCNDTFNNLLQFLGRVGVEAEEDKLLTGDSRV